MIAVQGRSSGVGFRRGGGFARGRRNSYPIYELAITVQGPSQASAQAWVGLRSGSRLSGSCITDGFFYNTLLAGFLFHNGLLIHSSFHPASS